MQPLKNICEHIVHWHMQNILLKKREPRSRVIIRWNNLVFRPIGNGLSLVLIYTNDSPREHAIEFLCSFLHGGMRVLLFHCFLFRKLTVLLLFEFARSKLEN